MDKGESLRAYYGRVFRRIWEDRFDWGRDQVLIGLLVAMPATYILWRDGGFDKSLPLSIRLYHGAIPYLVLGIVYVVSLIVRGPWKIHIDKEVEVRKAHTDTEAALRESEHLEGALARERENVDGSPKVVVTCDVEGVYKGFYATSLGADARRIQLEECHSSSYNLRSDIIHFLRLGTAAPLRLTVRDAAGEKVAHDWEAFRLFANDAYDAHAPSGVSQSNYYHERIVFFMCYSQQNRFHFRSNNGLI
jgi:hypothetical protein